MTDHFSTKNRLIGLAMQHAPLPEFKLLVERFEPFDLCATKSAAAAFGYLLAKEEAKEKEPWEQPPTIYDDVCTVLEGYSEGVHDLEHSADKLFGAVYQWLEKVPGIGHEALSDAFSSCLPPTDA
jgi:hypothetical protein